MKKLHPGFIVFSVVNLIILLATAVYTIDRMSSPYQPLLGKVGSIITLVAVAFGLFYYFIGYKKLRSVSYKGFLISYMLALLLNIVSAIEVQGDLIAKICTVLFLVIVYGFIVVFIIHPKLSAGQLYTITTITFICVICACISQGLIGTSQISVDLAASTFFRGLGNIVLAIAVCISTVAQYRLPNILKKLDNK
ncbi:MAG: hypothetical protein Q4E88_00295 [Coriobacteriia bacterium]|nr:hypothetical protein [Coriobacteriia bacterium]